MKLNDILTATCLVPLVASQLLGGDTYQTKNTTIDVSIGNGYFSKTIHMRFNR